jgi:hypothetical protein
VEPHTASYDNIFAFTVIFLKQEQGHAYGFTSDGCFTCVWPGVLINLSWYAQKKKENIIKSRGEWNSPGQPYMVLNCGTVIWHILLLRKNILTVFFTAACDVLKAVSYTCIKRVEDKSSVFLQPHSSELRHQNALLPIVLLWFMMNRNWWMNHLARLFVWIQKWDQITLCKGNSGKILSLKTKYISM